MPAVSRTFNLPVVVSNPTVLSDIVSTLQTEFPSSPAWSSQLADVSKRKLAEAHPLRPVDATTVNDPIGYDGTGLMLPQVAPWLAGGKRAFIGPNEASFDILTGAGGPYASHFDEVNNYWWIISGTTGGWQESQTLVRYDVSRDEFRHWQGEAKPSPSAVGVLWPGWGYPHNFGGSCLDPVGNRLWRLLVNQYYGGSEYTLGWVNLSDPTQRGQITTQVINRFNGNFPPMRLMPGLGTAGSIIVTPASGAFQRFDLESLTWGLTTFPSWSGYNRMPTVAQYGGDIYWSASALDGERGFYRIRPSNPTNREVLAVPPIPMNADAYFQIPYNTQLAGLNGKIYAFSNLASYADTGAIYEYDIATDFWTPEPIDTAFPYEQVPGQTGQHLTSFTIAEVESKGVILMARTQTTSSVTEVFVWKP